MTRIYDPPHPSETLREDVLPFLSLTITEAAKQLGVTRAAGQSRYVALFPKISSAR